MNIIDIYIEGLSVYVTPRPTAHVVCRKRREPPAIMSCCAVGCKNRFNKNNKTRKFYRIPSTRTPFKANRRRLWLEAIRRSDWNEQIIKNATICSDHFISGKP